MAKLYSSIDFSFLVSNDDEDDKLFFKFYSWVISYVGNYEVLQEKYNDYNVERWEVFKSN